MILSRDVDVQGYVYTEQGNHRQLHPSPSGEVQGQRIGQAVITAALSKCQATGVFKRSWLFLLPSFNS